MYRRKYYEIDAHVDIRTKITNKYILKFNNLLTFSSLKHTTNI